MHFSLLALSGLLIRAATAESSKNFIYIVPDGFGQSSQTMARDYASLLRNGENPQRPVTYQLAADQMVIGSVRTLASDNLVTDSAASATAFACGIKTYNGAIGVDDDQLPVGSILEAAHLEGYKTGLVATSRITHATPACYASHVRDRDSEASIAEHEIGFSHPLGPVVDVMLGGGRCFFVPKSTTGSCRTDDKDLLAFGKSKGFNVFTDRAGFDKLKKGEDAKLPYAGLFTNSHMSFEIDRNEAIEPSLSEMAETALNSLSKATNKSKKGFFIMIEASRIDHAAHSSDPVGHLHDIIEYNNLMSFIREWIKEHPDTQMISAADHECGGLTLYGYNPLILKAANASTEVLASKFSKYTGSDPAGFLRAEIFPSYGLLNPTDAEVAKLVPLKGQSSFQNEMGKMLSTRAGINWSTGGHTASDVTLFGYAAGSKGSKLRAEMGGNWDNRELPGYIEQSLKVRMQDATKALRKNGVGWVGKRDWVTKRVDGAHSHN